VADLPGFLAAAARLLRPGGGLVASTLNRTGKAYAQAILGAEYLLGWLPRGTHRWRKFVRPSELAGGLRPQGLALREIVGVTYRPLQGDWALSSDIDVNYMVFATKGAAGAGPT
jgi:2-polyprenyl-6-hydroxyphenyl methylase/3-demethylubiquinone-9 3-methyltransferase